MSPAQAGESKLPLQPDIALAFCKQLRQARAAALRSSEEFDEMIHAIERLGCFLKGRTCSLGKYETEIEPLANESALAKSIPGIFRSLHAPFTELYKLVRESRNDAMHQGAFARHLTQHAIELSLILEDAMSEELSRVSDYMVRHPVCAELWQPISFIRQEMLTNSFSFLPVKDVDGMWKVLSDQQLAVYLRTECSNRKQGLAQPLKDTLMVSKAEEASHCDSGTPVTDILPRLSQRPVLVFDEAHSTEPIGILTSFDVL